VNSELSARIAAATAQLTSFRRGDAAFIHDQSPMPNYGSWSLVLAEALSNLLSQLDAETGPHLRTDSSEAVSPDGSAALRPADLGLVLDALDVAADYKRDRAATCPDCDASPADLCGTCEWRLQQADEYDALAEKIRRPQ